MAFYLDMQAMVSDLLKADTEGGLGQTSVVLVRTVPGDVDPEHDWEPVEPTQSSEQLLAAVSGAAAYADGDTVLKTDRRVVSAVPTTVDWRMPQDTDKARLSLLLDGQPVAVVRVRGIPPVGVPVAVEFIARG